MMRKTAAMLALFVILWCAHSVQAVQPDIWTAAAEGNLKAIRKHVAADTDLNGKEPAGGSTPLHLAALAGQTEAARLLIESGASLNVRNNDGATPLHVAGFFGHPETVKLLLEKGADVTVKDSRGATALDTVSAEWNRGLEGTYKQVGAMLRMQLDLERIKRVRPRIADIMRQHIEKMAKEGTAAPDVDIWTAAAEGNLQAIRKHVAAGTDPSSREPGGGHAPLHFAALTGQTEAARLLIENGASLNVRKKDGATPLHLAAFFCHTETVKLLLEKGADVSAENNRGETALDTVAGDWDAGLAQLYAQIGAALKMQLDLGRIKRVRPQIANILRKHDSSKGDSAGKTVDQLKDVAARGLRCAYYMNGKIYVNALGTPEGDPVTEPPEGEEDFKPSWSKTGDKLVFFRRVKNAPEVTNWKTVVCVINVDGTGFQKLTDATHTNFNPTWTRDGTNRPIWNRKNPETGGFFVMWSKVGNKPGEGVAISDKRYHTWAHTCLKDGRILVECDHPTKGWGYYLMTPKPGGASRFERIDCGGLAEKGLLCRISVSPSEEKICFGHLMGHKFREPGHAIIIADFDVKKRAITNPKVIANEDRKPIWFAYPRWTKDEEAVVYHSYQTGRGGLYLYTLKDGSTVRVSTNPEGDYRYPHGEATPK